MQMVERRFPGVILLATVNADRIFSAGTVVLGLLAGAFLGSVIVGAY